MKTEFKDLYLFVVLNYSVRTRAEPCKAAKFGSELSVVLWAPTLKISRQRTQFLVIERLKNEKRKRKKQQWREIVNKCGIFVLLTLSLCFFSFSLLLSSLLRNPLLPPRSPPIRSFSLPLHFLSLQLPLFAFMKIAASAISEVNFSSAGFHPFLYN